MALTLVQARAHRDAWLAADLACAAGQSYSIGNRSLTRTNSQEIAERLSYWQGMVDQLESGRSAGPRVMRFLPRDL